MVTTGRSAGGSRRWGAFGNSRGGSGWRPDCGPRPNLPGGAGRRDRRRGGGARRWPGDRQAGRVGVSPCDGAGGSASGPRIADMRGDGVTRSRPTPPLRTPLTPASWRLWLHVPKTLTFQALSATILQWFYYSFIFLFLKYKAICNKSRLLTHFSQSSSSSLRKRLTLKHRPRLPRACGAGGICACVGRGAEAPPPCASRPRRSRAI